MIALEARVPEPRVLRVREASSAYRIGKTKIYAMIKSGELRSVKVGGTRLILVEALEELIKIHPN